MMNSSYVGLAVYLSISLHVHAQAPEEVGGLEVATILEMLGAKQEGGVSAGQRRIYQKHFGFGDHNGDGLHSAEEFIEKGSYLSPQARRGIFTASDADQDGTVTQAEYVLNRIVTDEAKALMQALAPVLGCPSRTWARLAYEVATAPQLASRALTKGCTSAFVPWA